MNAPNHTVVAVETLLRKHRQIQRVIPIVSPHFFPAERLAAVPDWRVEFGRLAPLALEIGCGTGHFILQRAVQQPESDFLAIDIYNKGCLKTCRKLAAAGLHNVRVARVEARELLLKVLRLKACRRFTSTAPIPGRSSAIVTGAWSIRDFLALA